MSLLDSNKRFLGTKSGKATVDLTSADPQETISFGGLEFNTLKFIVSGITNGLDVILDVFGGIVENYTKINTYNEAGELVSNITTNGTYYAKCTGLTGVYFSVTRTAANGTATVKWSLTTEGFTYQQNLNEIESKLNNQKVITPNAGVNLDLSSTGIKRAIQNENNFNCLVVNVSGMNSGTQAILDIVSTSSGYPKPSYLYNNFGEIFKSITKNGTYFVPLHELNGEIGIYCSRAGDTTATVKVELMKNFPVSITQLKPIQTLVNSDVEITSSSNVVLQNIVNYYENIPYMFFKYYFVQYSFKNGTSAVVRNSTLFAQPYYANNVMGKNTEIHNSTGDYATQSKWIEMNATYGIRFMISVPNYQAGDIVNFRVYGIR